MKVDDSHTLIAMVMTQFKPRFFPHAKVMAPKAPAPLRRHKSRRKSAKTAPDVVLMEGNGRVILIDAVERPGRVTRRRCQTLCNSYRAKGPEPVYVAAFRSRSQLRTHLPEICWGTVAWFADEPDHLMKFGGGQEFMALASHR